MYRQGDVLLIPVASVPERAFPLRSAPGRVVLARGEKTGHAHVLEGPQSALLQGEQQRYVSVGKQGATLRHEEHGAIDLPPGRYRLVIQREYRSAEDRGRQDVYD